MVKAFTTRNTLLDIVLAAVVMYVISFGSGALGGYLGGKVIGDGDLSALGLAIIGLLGGFVFGIIFALVIIKTMFRRQGSIILGIVAAAIWTGISIGVIMLLDLLSYGSSAIASALFLTVPLVALLGYCFKKQALAGKSPS